jgi:hypothetical protein
LATFGDATRNRNNPICVMPPKVTKASAEVSQVSLLPVVFTTMPMKMSLVQLPLKAIFTLAKFTAKVSAKHL